ncbi:MAG: hypothetical protein GC155_06105 [Alphaproteobacteria bacterium]|nr:hypothetical protein [Alphaproteobacteria bacterium]
MKGGPGEMLALRDLADRIEEYNLLRSHPTIPDDQDLVVAWTFGGSLPSYRPLETAVVAWVRERLPAIQAEVVAAAAKRVHQARRDLARVVEEPKGPVI